MKSPGCAVVDVVRTDNHLEFYENSKNMARMSDILAVYAWVDSAILDTAKVCLHILFQYDEYSAYCQTQYSCLNIVVLSVQFGIVYMF